MDPPEPLPANRPTSPGSGLLLSATVVAVLGSAVLLWRVRERQHHHNKQSGRESSHHLPQPQDAESLDDKKSSRSKERRRRAKDPFKDLLKSGKKLDKVAPQSPRDIIRVDACIQTVSESPSPTTPRAVGSPAAEPQELSSLRSALSERASELESVTGQLESSRSALESTVNDGMLAKNELDRAKWENIAWRRRCDEIQVQLQQVTHQLQLQAQSYAALFPHPVQYHSVPPHILHRTGASGHSATPSPITGSPASPSEALPSPSSNVGNSLPQSPTGQQMYHPMMYPFHPVPVSGGFPPSSMASPPLVSTHSPSFPSMSSDGYSTPPHGMTSPPIMSPTLIPIPFAQHQQYLPYPYQQQQPIPLDLAASRSRGRKREKKSHRTDASSGISEEQEQQLHAFHPSVPSLTTLSHFPSSSRSSNSDSNGPSSSSSSSSFGDELLSPHSGEEEEQLNSVLADAILKRPASFTTTASSSNSSSQARPDLMHLPLVNNDLVLIADAGVDEAEPTWPSIYPNTAKTATPPLLLGEAVGDEDDATPRAI